MTYALWNLATGNLVDWFHSEEDAYAAVLRVTRDKRADAGKLVLITKDHGHIVSKQRGASLLKAARSVAA